MQYNSVKHGSCGLLIGMSAAVFLGLGLSTASAQDDLRPGAQSTPGAVGAQAPAKPRIRSATATVKPAVAGGQSEASAGPVQNTSAAAPTAAKPNGNAGTPYFIEFRSRYALSYGHTYAVHGRVGQKITPKDVIGLHPATESSVPWMIGHLIPVVSETGASDGDAEEQYVSARYRVLLTKAEYAKLREFMNGLKSRSPLWHAAVYNCNAFVGDLARYVGLEVPSSFLKPKEFITELRMMNKGRTRVAATAPLYSSAQ